MASVEGPVIFASHISYEFDGQNFVESKEIIQVATEVIKTTLTSDTVGIFERKYMHRVSWSHTFKCMCKGETVISQVSKIVGILIFIVGGGFILPTFILLLIIYSKNCKENAVFFHVYRQDIPKQLVKKMVDLEHRLLLMDSKNCSERLAKPIYKSSFSPSGMYVSIKDGHQQYLRYVKLVKEQGALCATLNKCLKRLVNDTKDIAEQKGFDFGMFQSMMAYRLFESLKNLDEEHRIFFKTHMNTDSVGESICEYKKKCDLRHVASEILSQHQSTLSSLILAKKECLDIDAIITKVHEIEQNLKQKTEIACENNETILENFQDVRRFVVKNAPELFRDLGIKGGLSMALVLNTFTVWSKTSLNIANEKNEAYWLRVKKILDLVKKLKLAPTEGETGVKQAKNQENDNAEGSTCGDGRVKDVSEGDMKPVETRSQLLYQFTWEFALLFENFINEDVALQELYNEEQKRIMIAQKTSTFVWWLDAMKEENLISLHQYRAFQRDIDQYNIIANDVRQIENCRHIPTRIIVLWMDIVLSCSLLLDDDYVGRFLRDDSRQLYMMLSFIPNSVREKFIGVFVNITKSVSQVDDASVKLWFDNLHLFQNGLTVNKLTEDKVDLVNNLIQIKQLWLQYLYANPGKKALYRDECERYGWCG